MKRPLIGLIPQMDLEKGRLWNRRNYFEAVEEAGGLPVNLPVTEDPEELLKIADIFDGFLFTGGVDVDPAHYGEASIPEMGAMTPERDVMEMKLLPLLMERDKPVLGVCRGIQIINVALGGTLYQDLPAQHPSEIVHRQGEPYDAFAHTVTLVPGTPLAELNGQDLLEVNSMHHQAVRTLAPGLVPMAFSGDGVVEAVYAPQCRFLWAVQWHPEYTRLCSECSRRLFRKLVEHSAADGR